MALKIVGESYLDIADKYKRIDAGNVTTPIIEALAINNEIMYDAVAMQCSHGLVNKTKIRTGLPTPTWMRYYQYVKPNKSDVMQLTEGTGMLKAYSAVDRKMVDEAGADGRKLRMSEDMAFLEGFSQEWARTLFYGNSYQHPERFLGLAPRYSKLSTPEGKRNIIPGFKTDEDRSSGDYRKTTVPTFTAANSTSIWLVHWSDRTCSSLYPQGSKAGIQMEDLGVQLEMTTEGYREFYVSKYELSCGLSLRDWRYVVRICNIDTTKLWQYDFEAMMILALNNQHSQEGGKVAFYCNRAVRAALSIYTTRKDNMYFHFEDFGLPRPVMTFQGFPVRMCDSILNTESVVAA